MASSDCCDRASDVVLALLGGRWTWPPVTVTETYHAPHGRIHLSGRPAIVAEVIQIRDGADLTDQVTLFDGYVLTLPGYRCGGQGQRCADGGCIQVNYSYGSSPPNNVMQAIDALCAEMQKAEDGQPCRLPERVTSVTRQGMSWTLLDPQDFLNEGRTGLPEVDLVLSVYNPGKARARARVFTPGQPPGMRHPIVTARPL